MTRKELNNLYFEWMYQLVDGEGYSEGLSYRKLFKHLHETEFIFSVPMDANRADDGTDLRYRFAYEKKLQERMNRNEGPHNFEGSGENAAGHPVSECG